MYKRQSPARPRVKRVLARVDHGAIYLFIAGSYTPFALGVLDGPWGWTLFGLVWGMAAVGLTPVSYTHLDVYKRQDV